MQWRRDPGLGSFIGQAQFVSSAGPGEGEAVAGDAGNEVAVQVKHSLGGGLAAGGEVVPLSAQLTIAAGAPSWMLRQNGQSGRGCLRGTGGRLMWWWVTWTRTPASRIRWAMASAMAGALPRTKKAGPPLEHDGEHRRQVFVSSAETAIS